VKLKLKMSHKEAIVFYLLISHDKINAEMQPAYLCEKTMAEVIPIAKQKADEVIASLKSE